MGKDPDLNLKPVLHQDLLVFNNRIRAKITSNNYHRRGAAAADSDVNISKSSVVNNQLMQRCI
jgi:hypothetical protein